MDINKCHGKRAPSTSEDIEIEEKSKRPASITLVEVATSISHSIHTQESGSSDSDELKISDSEKRRWLKPPSTAVGRIAPRIGESFQAEIPSIEG